jgi:hypothetical protein
MAMNCEEILLLIGWLQENELLDSIQEAGYYHNINLLPPVNESSPSSNLPSLSN